MLGRSERVAEAIAEAIEILRHRSEIRVDPHLTGDAKEDNNFGVGGKIFGVSRKITNF